MVGGLTHFVLYKFIPTASGELLVWLNEWQTLIVGIAILVAGAMWTRSVIRSNQRTAYLVSQSLKLMTEAFAESSRRPVELATSTGGGRPGTAEASSANDLEQRLDRLRAVIRGALSVIPQTGERIDGNIARLLRNIANFSFDDEKTAKGLGEAQSRALAEVEKSISALRTGPVESMKCADAWETLVRLHRSARIARDASSSPAREKAA